MADEFERVNPITQKVLRGEISRRQMGTVYKWMKYEDLDVANLLSWKKDLQGLDQRGFIKWDMTKEAHLKFRSLVKCVVY